jgi:hypothetical protein
LLWIRCDTGTSSAFGIWPLGIWQLGIWQLGIWQFAISQFAFSNSPSVIRHMKTELVSALLAIKKLMQIQSLIRCQIKGQYLAKTRFDWRHYSWYQNLD